MVDVTFPLSAPEASGKVRSRPDTAGTSGSAGLEIHNLSMIYDPAQGPVLDDISLSIAPGQIHGIIGRSGAGKSTLVRTLNGLVRPSSGRVVVAGHDITALRGRGLRAARREIAMIFQHFSLMSARTVAENVALPMRLAGWPKDLIRRRVPELLTLVGLEQRADAYPVELSGGQKQRVGIARALALEPRVLLSDEATSALDPETTEQILDLLRDINRKLGLTIVLITHEMEVVRRIASHVSVLDHGKLAESGPVYEVFARPQSRIARSFLASVVAHDLPEAVAQRLLADPGPHTDPAIRITFTGRSAYEPVLANLVRNFGVTPNILHGRIDYIDGKPLGVLTLIAEAAEPRLSAILTYFDHLGLKGEVLGHVLRPVAHA